MKEEMTEILNQTKKVLQNIEGEWLESLEELKESKSENFDQDLFSKIAYLTSIDLFFKKSLILWKKSLNEIKKIYDFKNHDKDSKTSHELINKLNNVKMNIQNYIDKLDREYSILSEKTFVNIQDTLTKYNESKALNLSLTSKLNQDLDRKSFLQELKDSLESYREAREDSLSETFLETIRKYPDKFIYEDLGEENPEIDPILSQLDSAITECDEALLISEATETET